MFRNLLIVTGALLFALLMLASVVYDLVTDDYVGPPLPHSADIRRCRDAGGTPVMRYHWNSEVIVCQQDK